MSPKRKKTLQWQPGERAATYNFLCRHLDGCRRAINAARVAIGSDPTDGSRNSLVYYQHAEKYLLYLFHQLGNVSDIAPKKGA
jgi:hypothetical protein